MAWEFLQPGLEKLKGCRWHNLSGQPAPFWRSPTSRKVSLSLQCELVLFQCTWAYNFQTNFQCTAVKSLAPPCQHGGHSSATGAALGPPSGTFPLRVHRTAPSLLLKQGHPEQVVQEQPTHSAAASACGKTVLCSKGCLLLDCCRLSRGLGSGAFLCPERPSRGLQVNKGPRSPTMAFPKRTVTPLKRSAIPRDGAVSMAMFLAAELCAGLEDLPPTCGIRGLVHCWPAAGKRESGRAAWRHALLRHLCYTKSALRP